MDLKQTLETSLQKHICEASDEELYHACLDLVSSMAQKLPAPEGDKKLYYISAEFLIGKQLGKNLINLGIYDEMAEFSKPTAKTSQK